MIVALAVAGSLAIVIVAAAFTAFRAGAAKGEKVGRGDVALVYALGRRHEREDSLVELRRWRATTGNRKVGELIERIETQEHVRAGGRRTAREMVAEARMGVAC